jgi:hypothetical protein
LFRSCQESESISEDGKKMERRWSPLDGAVVRIGGALLIERRATTSDFGLTATQE